MNVNCKLVVRMPRPKLNLTIEERTARRREQSIRAVAKYRSNKSPAELRSMNSQYCTTWRFKNPEKIKEQRKQLKSEREKTLASSPRRRKFLGITVTEIHGLIDGCQISKVRKAARKRLFKS